MARSQVTTSIILNGQVGSGFQAMKRELNELGTSLSQMGRQLTDASREAVEFGKDSVDMYAGFDDLMRQVQGKLGTATRKEMSDLRDAAMHWAATTRYHATEVAQAISNAATSGWTLTEIYEGIPNVLNLAAGANMDLGEAVEFVGTALAGMDLDFEDSTKLVDMWLKTANNSRATVEDLGESLKVLGSMADFAENPEEVFTLLTALGQFGSVGSQAGTLLRNVMIRLVAPTKAARTAMAELGYTAEEISEAMEDDEIDLGMAADTLERIGFDAYDSSGKLKPFTRIISDLRKSLKGYTEKDLNNILSSIFPQRSIVGIMNLLRLTDEEYQQIMGNIVDSTGYAAEVAELQEGGIGGSLRLLESQWENLKITVGEQLAPTIQAAAGYMGDFTNAIAEMDPEKLNAMIGAVLGVAAAGAGLSIAGSALTFIASLASPGGAVLLASAAIGGLALHMNEVHDANMTEHFGEIELDMEALTPYINSLGDAFDESREEIDGYRAALEEAQEGYRNASAEMSEALLTKLLTGAEFTEQDREQLRGLGETMYTEAMNGLQARADETAAFLELRLNGEGDYSDPALVALGTMVGAYYANMQKEIAQKDAEMRAALTSAWTGKLTDEERQNIMGTVKEYNDVVSRATSLQSRAEMNAQLARAQGVSLDSMKDWYSATGEQYEQRRQEEEDRNLENMAFLDAMYEEFGDEYLGLKPGEWESYRAKLVDANNAAMAELGANYDEANMVALRTAIGGSDLSGTYDTAMSSVRKFLSGGMDASTLIEAFDNLQGIKDLSEAVNIAVEGMGGLEDLKNRAEHYVSSGNTGMAQELAELYTLAQFAQAANGPTGDAGGNGFLGALGTFANSAIGWAVGAVMSSQLPNGSGVNPMQLYEYSKLGGETLEGLLPASTETGGAFQQTVPAGERIGLPAPTETGGAIVQVEPDWTEFDTENEVMLEDAQETLNAKPLGVKLREPDGEGAIRVALVRAQRIADENPIFLRAIAISEHGFGDHPGGLRENVKDMSLYAEGGRATEPGILGEAGPEWAIPEEHTQNTLNLLAAAAAASGFTASDMASATAAATGGNTLVYSPTVIAEGGAGTVEALDTAFEKFKKWARDEKLIARRTAVTGAR